MLRPVIVLALFAGILPLSGRDADFLSGHGSDPEIIAKRTIAKPEANPSRLTELERENADLKRENTMLRKELIETLDKYSTQAGRLKRMEMSAAGTIETLEPVYMGAREMELADDLQTSLTIIGQMSAGILKFYGDLESVLPKSKLNKPEVVELKRKLEELKELGLKGALAASPAKASGSLNECRILELAESPQLVILSSGYRDGVQIGMTLRCGKVRLRILAARSFVSAGIVTEGSFRSLSPGMRAETDGKR